MFCLIVLACIFLAEVNGHVLHNSHHHTRPYQVGYYIRDPDHHQHAEEIRDHGGAVAGRYGYLDTRRIGRHVNYVADHAGLRARVHTNEPAVVYNTPAVATYIASDNVAVAPTYISVLVYGYGLNGYDDYCLGYGYSGVDNGYGNALGYTGLLVSYGTTYA